MNSSQIAALIRETAELYVVEPKLIEVNTQESTKKGTSSPCTFFVLRGAKTDEARLVGRKGCHVNALNLLILQVGKAQAQTFTFLLISDPNNVAPWVAQKDAFSYDPEPTKQLLLRWLRALDVSLKEIRVQSGEGPQTTLSYDFVIDCADSDDARDLLKPINPGDDQSSIVGALGTLYRAIARQAGVRFQIRVEPSHEPAAR